MRAVDMAWTCHKCEYYRPLRYADGRYSIQCVHPVNDQNTTRDIVILDACPKDTEQAQKG